MRQIWILGLLSIAGCAAPGGGASVSPGVVPAEITAGADLPPAQGETRTVVRTFSETGGQSREVSGATCTAVTPYSRATFAAPARIGLPDLGAQSPAVRVTCAQGALAGTIDVLPARRPAQGGLGGWPAVGLSVNSGGGVSVGVGGWWNAGRTAASPRTVYPEIRVLLR